MSLDDAIADIPRGMIWRLETMRGNYYCLLGNPTKKFGFSMARGKYPGIGETPEAAVRDALKAMPYRR